METERRLGVDRRGGVEHSAYTDIRLADFNLQLDRLAASHQRELVELRALLAERLRAITESEKVALRSIERDFDQSDKRSEQRLEVALAACTALDERVMGLFEEKQKALESALVTTKEAVIKAETATERIASRAQADTTALREDTTERLAALRRELEAATQAQKRELELATAAQKEAVAKAETATEKRFESTNEWRAQSLDRERSQAEEHASLTATFLPRETFQTKMASMDTWRSAMEARMNQDVGNVTGHSEFKTDAHNANIRTTQVMGVIATVVIGLLIILTTIAVATHGFTQ